jgi:hypothetical protein
MKLEMNGSTGLRVCRREGVFLVSLIYRKLRLRPEKKTVEAANKKLDFNVCISARVFFYVEECFFILFLEMILRVQPCNIIAQNHKILVDRMPLA